MGSGQHLRLRERGYGQPDGRHGCPDGPALVPIISEGYPRLPRGAVVGFHRPGEAPGQIKMSSVIVLSRNDPHQLPGEPRKTGPSTQAGPAATRHNGTLCLTYYWVNWASGYPHETSKNHGINIRSRHHG
jgi:hypothetical protein